MAEELILAEIDELYDIAKEIADENWALSVEAKETMPINEWAKYRARVRRKTNSISIEWHRVWFVGPSGKRRPLSKYIPRGKSYAYRMSSFRQAPDWELHAIEQFEKQFAPMRKQIECLVKALRMIRNYARDKEKYS